ncbi:MAG: sigma-70 family RNA polymerase sigma factor [Planctomycetota bacterium]|nr:sigma-70 family RNA polymerase sigma factor [Planctomycetota bacterium]
MNAKGADSDLQTLRAADEADRERVLGELFEEHRRRLQRMVHLRMDAALRARVGASDVLQEAFVEVSGRVGTYLQDPRMPFFLWLRFLTAQKLVDLYRHHVGTQKRDARKQVRIDRAAFPAASSAVMAEQLVGGLPSPSGTVMREEMCRQVQEGLDRMKPADREVLVMRHFEELTHAEAATELGISEDAASKRYLRALQRLRSILEEAGSAEAGA